VAPKLQANSSEREVDAATNEFVYIFHAAILPSKTPWSHDHSGINWHPLVSLMCSLRYSNMRNNFAHAARIPASFGE
jgi:hypothetical protein